MQNVYYKSVINMLWSLPESGKTHLYVVLDGARNKGICPAVLKSGCEFECLYIGELDPELAAAAPYLVKLERNKPFADWVIREGWGDNWGIFVQSAAAFREMKRHFRKFLTVYDATAIPLFFRYYDPRVLRVFLSTCNTEELASIFGPIKCYLLEDKDPQILLHFSSAANVLQTNRTSIAIQPETIKSGIVNSRE